MPNKANIRAPLMLISAGRSGTTLMSNIFAARVDTSSCGETADLIFDLWNTAQRSLAHITPAVVDALTQPVDARAGDFVRSGFLALLSDDREFWFHKPIGIPFAFSAALFDVESWEERSEAYWKVMRSTFPQARAFTILRHPCDVVMSYKQRFDDDERSIWAKMGFLAQIILHRDSMVGHAVSYERLVTERDETLRALLDFLGLDDDGSWKNAFDFVHSASADRPSSANTAFTWRDRWAELDMRQVEPRFLAPIRTLHQRFGYPLELPTPTGPSEELAHAPAQRAFPGQAPAASRDGGLTPRNLELLWEERATRLESDLHRAYLHMERGLQTSYTRLEREFKQSHLELESAFAEANRQAVEHLQHSYSQMEAALNELTRLRSHPVVRVLRLLQRLRLRNRNLSQPTS